MPRLQAESSGSIEAGIYSALTAPFLGNKANRGFLNEQTFASQIGPSIRDHQRLQFLLPAFPFKDQNLFRTEAQPEHIDLGEIALLIRLHALALAFFQFHPFGADWIVLADGASYAHALGVDVKQAHEYRENLRNWRNALNLQGTVSILDLDEVAKKADGVANRGRFDAMLEHIKRALSRLRTPNEAMQQAFAVLMRGMAWNLATRSYDTRHARREIWQAVTQFGADGVRYDPLSSEIRERSEIAALHYGAYNLTLRWLEIADRMFPNAIRATVHPKANQVAVPSLGDVYPWNGVPIVRGSTFAVNEVSVQAWYRARADSPNLVGLCERDGEAPMYYQAVEDVE